MTNDIFPEPQLKAMNGEVQATVNRVAVKLPAFLPTDPELWFKIAERSLELSSVGTETTKFEYVVITLESRYALEVRDVIMDPPAEHPYSTLKDELIKRLSTSQEHRTRQLLEREEIGDRKPTQFLRHLRSLAGSTVNDDLLRTLWISRLPQQMQVILVTQKDSPLDKVAELADTIADATTSRPVIAAINDTSIEAIVSVKLQQLTLSMKEELSALRQEIEELSRESRQSRSTSQRRTNNRNRSKSRAGGDFGMCWYHRRFGAEATRCTTPCSYTSGNERGSRQ